MSTVRRRVYYSGRVQGVGFRFTSQRLAERYLVGGYVRNLDDGRVEAVFEGPAEDVRHLLDWARHGPRLAVVTGLAVHAERPEALGSFVIR